MKTNILRRILQWNLFWLARFILVRHKPQIIGITGTVGKTSTKDAIAVVLRNKLRVRATQENYNNEIGVPLTIIGTATGGRNPIRWLYIFCKALAVGVFKTSPYPEVLIIEMGVDKPGDMKYLTTLAPVDIAIVTAITETPAHMERFKDIEQLAKEKFIIYKAVDRNGLAIINSDEPRAVTARDTLKGLSTSIGITEPADLTASAIDFAFDPQAVDAETVVASNHIPATSPNQGPGTSTEGERRAAGLRFKFLYQGSVVPVFIPGVIGKPTVYSALFAAMVGLQYDINLIEISAALKQYQPPRGRLRVLAAKNGATIIDDTYNASPAAVKEALITLQSLTTPGRKLVCLGEMAELGKSAKVTHMAIGKLVAKLGVDKLIVVGEAGEWIAQAATQAGLPEEAVQRYTDSVAAGDGLSNVLQPRDVVLVKGSQVARMEKTVKTCLAPNVTATEVLVRQYGNWSKI